MKIAKKCTGKNNVYDKKNKKCITQEQRLDLEHEMKKGKQSSNIAVVSGNEEKDDNAPAAAASSLMDSKMAEGFANYY